MFVMGSLGELQYDRITACMLFNIVLRSSGSVRVGVTTLLLRVFM